MKYKAVVLDTISEFKEAKQYWVKQLAGITGCFVYPHERSGKIKGTAEHHFTLPHEVASQCVQLSKYDDLLLYTLLSAAMKTVFYKTSFENEIVIGAPIHSGYAEDSNYNRYLLLLSRLEGEMSFRELLLNESQTVNEAIQHQYYPFENLIKPLKLDESRLYRTILLLENIHDPAMVEPLLPQNDLMIAFRREGENVEATVRYRTDVYTAESIRLLADRFGQVLAQALDHVDTKLKEFRFHEPETVRKRWETFNRTEQAYPKQATVHGLFEQQVQLTPEAPAVESGSQTVSYRELNERAERVAQLLRLCGAGRGRRVGIMAGHGPGLLAGILGVLKSGASYVPVDPDYPMERIRYMAEDSGLCAWVVEPGLEGSVPKEQVQGVVVVDDRGRAELLTDSGEAAVEAAAAVTAVEAEVAAAPETLIEGAAEVTTGAGKETAPEAPSEVTSEAGPEGTAEAEDEAYVIYTSGSTGRPKGVMVRHRNVVNYLWWARKMYLKGLDSVSMALYSSIAFDLTVTSLFLPLIAGGCVVAYRSEHRGQALMRVLEEDRVDVLKLTPTHLRLLAEEAVARPRRLKRLIVGGESLDSGLARRVSERFGHEVEIYNEYGPTEATVGCMIHRYAPEKDTEGSVPIGIPADNVQIYVLDPYGHPTPTGVIGEIYIGGEGVAVGYVGNPELTAERFVPNRHGGGRLYRTGDLGRRLPDGTLQYVGRRDEQVKVRGHRIELGEIELELQGHEAVKAAAVVARPDEGGELELWAYVQVNGTGLSEELKRYLSERLPEYMIPAYIEEREQLPVTSNGKIDRKALLEEEGSQRTPYVAPRNELEQRLVQLWEEVLGRDRIGIEDDFFKIGGHSLKVIMMLARVKKQFLVDVPLSVLFNHPTISKLSEYIQSSSETDWTAIPQAEPSDYYPATSVQKRLYALSQLNGGETVYNMPGAFVIGGPLDLDRFREALHALIQRHESLRTSFAWKGEELVQRVHEHVEFEAEYATLSDTADDEEAEIAKLGAQFVRPFDLSRAPLLRVKLVKTAEDRHVVLFDMHHIISDGVSMDIFAREFLLLYEGQELEPLRIQYKDIAVWQARQRETEAFRKREAYWLKKFADGVPALELPTDFPRPPRQSFEGGRFDFVLDKDVVRRIHQLSRESGATVFMILLAAWNVLLSKYAGVEDIVVGTTVAGRNHADMEKVVGLFINTLALRNRPSGDKTFQTFLFDVRDNTLEAFEHQDYPFEDLVDKLSDQLDPSRSPLFDTMLVVHNQYGNSQADVRRDEMQSSTQPGTTLEMDIGFFSDLEHHVAKFDLTLVASQHQDGMNMTIEYAKSLFRRETVERIAGHYVAVLETFLSRPGMRLSDFELLAADEKERLETFNRTEQAYPKQATVHGLFEQQVQLTPEAPAVESGSQTVSYRELNERAERVAQLLRLCGAGRGRRVGIMAGHGPGLLAGILGVLKSGASYVPVDPDYPMERIRYMAEDSGLCAWVVEPGLEGSVPKEQVQGVVVVDDRGRAELLTDSGEAAVEAAAAVTAVEAEVAAAPETLIEGAAEVTTGAGKETAPEAPSEVTSEAGPEGTAEAEDEAYVIYTSGSTGRPKGVMVRHRNVVNYLWWARKMYLKGLDSVSMALYSSIAFDLTVTSLFLPLIAGGCVVAYRSEHRGQALMRVLEEDRVDVLKLTPTHLRLLAEEAVARPRRLKRLIVGGESLDSGLARRVSERFGHEVEIYNEYGPTEATVGCMIHRYAPEKDTEGSVPIGIPADNVQIYVLDPYGHPTPTGVIGEIYIGGEGVAVGYVGNPELTAERFVPNRHGGGRLYRTGDLGRRLPDGTLQYVGRRDEQVKVRGHRIELGEIELELQGHEAVKAAAVVARPDEGGELELWAYVQVNGTGLSEELKRYLSERLPEYMIPAYIEEREQLPVTSNGKIDRKALLEEEGSQRTPYVAPRNELEQRLVQLWEEVLGRDRIGIEDDFFKIGGHSLKAIMMLARVQREWSVNVPLAVLFDTPTVSGLASYVEDALNRRKEHSEPEEEQVESWQRIEPAEPREYYPVTSIQKRIYTLSNLRGAETTYNMPGALGVDGDFSVERFKSCVKRLIERHESLRTSFEWKDGELVQRIHEHVDFDIPCIQCREDQMLEVMRNFLKPFDLSKAPLMRVELVQLEEKKYVVLFDMHHIISDGVSMNIFAKEFMDLYRGAELEPLRIQYKDVAVWQQSYVKSEAYAKSEAYWLEQFKNEVPLIELPTDFPRSGSQTFVGQKFDYMLTNDFCAKLDKWCRETGATPFMFLLAVFNVLLAKYSGLEDITIGTTVAGRNNPDMEKIMGVFINTLALRNAPAEEKTFYEFLLEVKENTLQAFEHQMYPFEDLVEKLGGERDVSRNPLFDTMLVLHNHREYMDETLEPRFYSYEGLNHNISKFDLTLVATHYEENLLITLEYSSQLFKRETGEEILKHYIKILKDVLQDPHQKIRSLSIVSEHEREELLSRISLKQPLSSSGFDL